MKIKLLFVGALGALNITGVYAQSCVDGPFDCDGYTISGTIGSETYAAPGSTEARCYKGSNDKKVYKVVESIAACLGSYSNVAIQNISLCDNMTGRKCECECDESVCNQDWKQFASSGLVVRKYNGISCQCTTSSSSKICTAKVQYGCLGGYYGTATDGNTYNCKRCPQTSAGVYGTSVSGDNATITKCYIPKGKTFSDTTGKGIYAHTGDCYYSN